MKQFEVYGDAMQIYTEACIIWLAGWTKTYLSIANTEYTVDGYTG